MRDIPNGQWRLTKHSITSILRHKKGNTYIRQAPITITAVGTFSPISDPNSHSTDCFSVLGGYREKHPPFTWAVVDLNCFTWPTSLALIQYIFLCLKYFIWTISLELRNIWFPLNYLTCTSSFEIPHFYYFTRATSFLHQQWLHLNQSPSFVLFHLAT